MGKLHYSDDFTFDVEDHVLAHLRVVVMNKLRRNEPFMLQLPDTAGIGHRSMWLAPAVPVVFQFSGSRQPALDKGWVEEMMSEASGPNGLSVTPDSVKAALERAARGGAQLV